MSIIKKDVIKTHMISVDRINNLIENKKNIVREYKYFFNNVINKSDFKEIFGKDISEKINVYEKNEKGNFQEYVLNKSYYEVSIKKETYDKFDACIKVIYSSENDNDLFDLEFNDVIKSTKNYNVTLNVNSLFDKDIMSMWICYVSLINSIDSLFSIYGEGIW